MGGGGGGRAFMHWHFTSACMLLILLYVLGTTLDTLVQANFSYPACGGTEILYITVVLPESDVIFETLQ